jgi:hypothetical protein
MAAASRDRSGEPPSRAAEVVATRRAEAVALFEANQRGRARAGGLVGIALLTILAAGIVGIACHAAALAIPVPTVLLLLSAELFQYYTDVTVMGAARRQLEEIVNAELGTDCLIYESLVADIRKRPPLVMSERLLQATGTLVVLSSVVVGAIVAYSNRPAWVQVLYPMCTVAAFMVALVCYRAMLLSGRVVAATLCSLDG